MTKRHRRPRWALPVLGLAWLVLTGAALAWGVPHTEHELARRAASALDAAGVDAGPVDFEGRDAILPSAAGAEVVRAVEGVRTVRVVGSVAAETTGEAPTTVTSAPEPTATTAAPETTTTTTSTTTTTTTTVPEEPAEATPPPPSVPALSAHLSAGTLVLAGTLTDAEAATRIATVADLIYAPFLQNDLVVAPDLPPAPWEAAAADAIAVLPIVGEAALTVEGDRATLAGSAGNEIKKGQLEGALGAILGAAGVDVESTVEVTGLVPPVYDASASGDGTVVLRGVMPDEEVLQLIAGAAIQTFGAENVVNEMSVGEGIDRTFSLFRIPLTFVAFAPVPQWEVHIENDVISGGLRGGATFEFESAELTPELERLATIAGGIMLRNPTITMTIEGHTDAIGGFAFNQRLSEQRAENGKAFIVALGVDPERLTAVGFGETRPIASNDTDEGRAQNRRLEFVMGPTQGDE